LTNILIAHDTHAVAGAGDIVSDPILTGVASQHLGLAQTEALRAEWLRQKEQIMQSWEWRIKLAFVGGVLNALNYVTQKFAHDAAEMILTGGESGVPLFHTDQWGDYLANTADGAVAHIIDSMDTFVGDYTEENIGQRLSLCHKPDPLAIGLSIGLGEMGQPGPGQCTISNMVRNFGAVADMVESGDAIQMHKVQFTPTGNDLHAGLSVNNMVIQDAINEKEAALLNRLENKGMSPIIDHISGKIKYPSMMAQKALENTEPTGMLLDTEKEQRAYMMQAYWSAGIEAIWYTAISTFANTLVFGILQRIFAESGPGGTSTKSPDAMVVQYEVLTNQDAAGEAQDLYERREFAKALGDYITPNYGSADERDLITELMTCTTPRTRWNCAMDQAFAVSLNVGTTDGALTVGRASGVGSEGASYKSSAQGLHPEWELIPESDIKNNTDPSCATRAYCAGNLKKLRLARIIPIGWEMAANSPFNIKKSGKYVTLAEVIRGFYNCNDQGELDKDHPWCHLIDPNWILAAPKYMCRTRGYGDTLIPDIGTRLEECGDVASCLGTNQNNECDKGYGYCLAEKPVYRFDARTCDEQFSSCRTYNYSGGQLSALRFTIDRGNCSADNIGCMWYATDRYVSSTFGVNPTPDGLWVGTATAGPRLYADQDVEPCTEEGCTKVLSVDIGSSALNLIQNGSFEDTIDRIQNDQTTILDLEGWALDQSAQGCAEFDLAPALQKDSFNGNRGLTIKRDAVCTHPDVAKQTVVLYPNRNYTFSYYSNNPDSSANGNLRLQFRSYNKTTGQKEPILGTADDMAFYGDCSFGSGSTLSLNVLSNAIKPNEWQKHVC
ncbi:hypothetical protein KKG46_04040, partial [Patescibacteria group bacterium]|nr:hypothetical protein [Patescibacteria group bacterium]